MTKKLIKNNINSINSIMKMSRTELQSIFSYNRSISNDNWQMFQSYTHKSKLELTLMLLDILKKNIPVYKLIEKK